MVSVILRYVGQPILCAQHHTELLFRIKTPVYTDLSHETAAEGKKNRNAELKITKQTEGRRDVRQPVRDLRDTKGVNISPKNQSRPMKAPDIHVYCRALSADVIILIRQTFDTGVPG